MARLKKTTFYVSGMHCPSCDILINDKFKEIKNVVDVRPDFNKQKVEVSYTGHLDKVSLNSKIKPFNYEIIERNDQEVEPLPNKIFEAISIAVIIIILYFFARELSLIPDFNFTGRLNLLTILLIGLVASTSTCMATSGALFLSTVGKNKDNFSQAVFFNSGRIFSYGFFGFLAGLVGHALVTFLKLGPILTLLTAIFMVFLGLDMLRILSIGSIIPSSLNKSIFEKLEHKLMKYPRKTSFFLGAITYLLPCGFTQAVQVYALGLASPIRSAFTMMIFAVGTMPALILIGMLSNFTKSAFYSYFIKVMAVLVLIIGLIYFSSFTSFYGISLNPLTAKDKRGTSAQEEDGIQIINMKVVSSGYLPNYFTVKKGVPVKWKIQGEDVYGCQAYLIIPKLGIQKTISSGENLIEFTPKEAGPINFSCGMGMFRGQIEAI